jgi:hypothetical protein
MNLDGSRHDCSNRPYNRRKQQGLQMFRLGKKWHLKPCKYCSQSITFNDGITAPSGKRIPLNADGSHHECPYNQYNLARRQSIGV